MTTTIELLDAAKVAAGCGTDYQFAKKYGLHLQTVSGWRTEKRTFDDNAAELIAGILGREPGEVMAICQAYRAKDEKSRARWLHVAALLAAIGLPPAHGGQFDNNAPAAAKNKPQTANYAQLLRRFLFGDWLHLA